MALELFPVEYKFLFTLVCNEFGQKCIKQDCIFFIFKINSFTKSFMHRLQKGSKISSIHIFQSPDLNLEEPCIGAGGVWRDLRRRPPLAEALSEVGDALEEVGAGAPCAQRFSLLRRFRCRPRGNTKLKL